MKKCEKKTRLFTLTLALCMVFAIMVVGVLQVSAEDTPEAKWGDDKDSLTYSGTLAEALEYVADNRDEGYIQLQGNIDLSEPIGIEPGITLDLSKITSGTYYVKHVGSYDSLEIGKDIILPENYGATKDGKYSAIVYSGQTIEIAPHEHNFTDFDVTPEMHTLKCACGALGESESHNFVKSNRGQYHVCTVCNEPGNVQKLDGYWCKDENNDHKCDLCDGVYSECEDKNNDHDCDTCGEKLSEHYYYNDPHICNICQQTTECQDLDPVDDKCDACGKWMPFDIENRVPCKTFEVGEGSGVIVSAYRANEEANKFDLVLTGSGEVPSDILEDERLGNAYISPYDINSVTIGGEITSIAAEAFQNAWNLSKVVIENSVSSIGDKAFYGCPLESLVIGSGVKTIGAEAFASNDKLKEITLPEGLQSIGNEAFMATALTTVNIPSTVASIGENAFANTYSLTAFTVSDGNTAYSALDGVLFNADKTELVFFPTSKELQSYTVPASVKTVKENSFMACDKLAELIIPASVEKVESNAFINAKIGCYIFEGAATVIDSFEGDYMAMPTVKAHSNNESITSAIANGLENKNVKFVSLCEGDVCAVCGYVGGKSETTTESDVPANNGEKKNGLPIWATVLIVVGGIVVLSVGVYAILWFGVKKKTWAELVTVFKTKNFKMLLIVFQKDEDEEE